MRYARWNLGRVDLVDPQTATILAPLYPLDPSRQRRRPRPLLEPTVPPGRRGRAEPSRQIPAARVRRDLPPLLNKILPEYSATGLPPAYLPKNPPVPADGDALMNTKKLLALWGLKWNPFSPESPVRDCW